jgi:hypothetical protein
MAASAPFPMPPPLVPPPPLSPRRHRSSSIVSRRPQPSASSSANRTPPNVHPLPRIPPNPNIRRRGLPLRRHQRAPPSSRLPPGSDPCRARLGDSVRFLGTPPPAPNSAVYGLVTRLQRGYSLSTLSRAGVSSPSGGGQAPPPSTLAPPPLPAESRRAATRAGRRVSARPQGRRRGAFPPCAGGAGWARPPQAIGAARRRGSLSALPGGGLAGSGIAMTGSGVPRRGIFVWRLDGRRSGGGGGS